MENAATAFPANDKLDPIAAKATIALGNARREARGAVSKGLPAARIRVRRLLSRFTRPLLFPDVFPSTLLARLATWIPPA